MALLRHLKAYMDKDKVEEMIRQAKIDESSYRSKIKTFDLGLIVATPGALKAFIEDETAPEYLLLRHAKGDWGDITEHDAHQNEFAIRAGLRLLSAYKLKSGKKIWIITEGDRSSTTLLLPEEY